MDATKFKIYSLLVVKNEADVISASLKDACRWSDKIIVIDNSSTDGTWERVQELSATHSQIVPWMRYEGPFHIGLRAKAFRAFRHEMTSRDWWCVRLDADEFYPTDVRSFLAQVPRWYTTVKKESTDYILTHEDLSHHTFTGDFEQDRLAITHALPSLRRERRFMRHSRLLCWLERWRYPHPWGRVYYACLPVNHYQYRSPQQMQQRFATRQQAKTDGCGSFHHEQGKQWQDYLLTDKQLEEQYLLAHIDEAFAASEKMIHQGRNILKIIGKDIVVKSFHRPRFPNSLIYGWLRASKAKRSFLHAQLLGDLTPEPLAYTEQRQYGLLQNSYYACRLSALPYTWRMVARNPHFANREHIVRGIGVFMARMHATGCYPLDFSGGNILLNADGSHIQIVDINRMRRFNHIGLWLGCHQTQRLHLTDADCRWLAEAYAKERDFDVARCYTLLKKHHISITNE